MGYRSPTIHSSVLKMAGSPIPKRITGKELVNNGDKNGYNDVCDRNCARRRNGRGIDHPFLHQRGVN